MKYTIRGFLMEFSGREQIKVAFNGCLLYKRADSSYRFVFPWNVTWLEGLSSSDFPLVFWGLKGKQQLNRGDLDSHPFVWRSGKCWPEIIPENRILLDTGPIGHDLQVFCEPIQLSVTTLDEQLYAKMEQNSRIAFTAPDLSHLTSFTIPDTISKKQN